MSFTSQNGEGIEDMKSTRTGSIFQEEKGENSSSETFGEKSLDSFPKSLSNRNPPPVNHLTRLPASNEVYNTSEVQSIYDQLDYCGEAFKEEIKLSDPKIKELLEVRERQALEDEKLNSSLISNQSLESNLNPTTSSSSSQDINDRPESGWNRRNMDKEALKKAVSSLITRANDKDHYQNTQSEGRSEDTVTSQSNGSSSKIDSKNKEKSKSKSKEDIKDNENHQNGGFACNICFDTASNPVLTFCGHLYCWPCLHNWLKAQPYKQLCAVCKAGCGKDKVIPVYGRGSDMKDPRLDESIPDRPKGQRPEPTIAPGFRTFESFMSGFGEPRVSASYFSMFSTIPTLSFQYSWDGGAPPNNESTPQQAFLSRLFLMVGILFVIANLLG